MAGIVQRSPAMALARPPRSAKGETAASSYLGEPHPPKTLAAAGRGSRAPCATVSKGAPPPRPTVPLPHHPWCHHLEEQRLHGQPSLPSHGHGGSGAEGNPTGKGAKREGDAKRRGEGSREPAAAAGRQAASSDDGEEGAPSGGSGGGGKP